MHANEMQEMYAKHHKVVPNLNSLLKHKYNPKKKYNTLLTFPTGVFQ